MLDPEPLERLYEIACGIADGDVFHSAMLECPEEAGCIFTPLVLMHETQLAALMADEPGLIWEWKRKAVGEEAGMPIFLSCNYLSKADANTVLIAAERHRLHSDNSFEDFSKTFVSNQL